MENKKKGIYLVLAAMLIVGILRSTVLAREQPQNVVSTSDIGLVLGSINLVEYERAINSGISFYVAPGLGFVRINSSRANIFGAMAGIKKYFGGTALHGLWFGGYGGFFRATVSLRAWDVTVSDSLNIFAGGANIGYKYFITDRFTIEARLGAMFLTSDELRGFGLTSGVNVGYAF